MEISVLVGDDQKTHQVRSKYSQMQCVIGNFSSLDLIGATCRATDIVINVGPDITHDKALEAAHRGYDKAVRAARRKAVLHTYFRCLLDL